MSWTCPNCKAENPEGARFCTQCGAPAQTAAEPPQAAPTPTAAPAPPAQSIAEAPPGQNQTAGPEPVTAQPKTPAAPAAPTTPQPPKKGGKVVVITLVIAAVVLIGFCLLGIIAAIAIPNFLDAKARAQQKRSVADIQTLARALEAYHADKGSYPPVNQSDTETFGLGTIDPLQKYLVPDYIQALPKADGWGHPYLYGANSEASSFILMSLGSDGVQGDEGVPEEHVTTNCYQDDILWKDDAFLQEPEGKQRDCPK